jgi:hypothetical protein
MTTKTSRTFRIFWITNGELRQTTITTKYALSSSLNYLEYVNDSNLDAHVRVFKSTTKANGETKVLGIVNLFSFTLGKIVFDWCNFYMEDYPY